MLRAERRLKKLILLDFFYKTVRESFCIPAFCGILKSLVKVSPDYPDLYEIFKDGRFAKVNFAGEVVWCKRWEQEELVTYSGREAQKHQGEVDIWIDNLIQRNRLHPKFFSQDGGRLWIQQG